MNISQQVSKSTSNSFNLLTCLIFYLLLFFICSGLACSAYPPSTSKALSAYKFIYRNHSFDIIEIEPKDNQLNFFLANEQGKKYRSFQNLKSALESKNKKLIFAINGGMYLKDGSPQGLFIQDKKVITPIDTVQKAYGNFYLQPNGIFYIKAKNASVLTTADYLSKSPNPDFATQSGPMLVIRDSIHPVFVEGSKNLHIRNGVGINKEGKIFFAISNNKINLFDFAMLFQEKLNCPNALYLDGFVSKAYIPELDRTELGGNFGVIIGLTD